MKTQAILCGVREYGVYGDLPSLPQEISQLAAVLKDGLHKDYRCIDVQQHVDLTLDTLDEILKRAQTAAPIDRLFFYLAGHGCVRNNHAYFVLPDAKPAQPGIRLDELTERLLKIPIARKFIVLDFCRSGHALDTLLHQGFDRLVNIPHPTDMAVLASCARDQNSPGGTSERSLTAHLIDAFANASVDQEGVMRWSDIVSYVDEAMDRSIVAQLRSYEASFRRDAWNQRTVANSKIVVLPPEVIPPTPQSYADDFAIEVIRALSAKMPVVGWLEVRNLQSPRQRSKIATDLQASYVMDGTITIRGKKFDVYWELVEPGRGVILSDHQNTLKKKLHQLPRRAVQLIAKHFDLQSTVRAISTPTKRGKREKKSTDLPALAALLRDADYHFHRRTADGFEKALTLYQQALTLNPSRESTAAINAGIARCYALRAGYGYEFASPIESAPLALAAARAAVAADPNSSDAHLALANILHDFVWDYRRAEQEYKAALRHGTYNATARLWYGIFLLQEGQTADALEELRQAEYIASHSAIVLANVGWAYGVAGDIDTAEKYYERLADRDPTLAITDYFRGQTLAGIGQYANAAVVFDRARSRDDRPIFRAFHAYASARSGQSDAAQRLLEEADAHDVVSGFHRALALLGLQRWDDAMTALRQTINDGSSWATWLQVHPVFVPLRERADFQALIARAHTPNEYYQGVVTHA